MAGEVGQLTSHSTERREAEGGAMTLPQVVQADVGDTECGIGRGNTVAYEAVKTMMDRQERRLKRDGERMEKERRG